MRFSFVIASLVAVACSVSCSSASFNVASSGDGGGTDAGGDGGVDPCAPIDGIAKFCVTVTPTSHPGYDSSTGAVSLGLDGKGTLQLLLFNQDPVAHPKTTPTIINYNGGAELDIDADFPVTIGGPVTTAGTYWFIALFEDDTTTARDLTKADSNLAGDFETVPTFDSSFTLQIPQVVLTTGTTQPKTLDIHPVRRIVAGLDPTDALKAVHLSNSSVHGDGPVEFVVYDGSIEAPTILGVAVANDCVKLFEPGVGGYPIRIPFNTFVDGKHNVLGAIYDYPLPDKSFPGKGTILSPTKDGVVDKIPVMDPGSAWSTEIEVRMSQVPDPYSPGSEPADTLTCP